MSGWTNSENNTRCYSLDDWLCALKADPHDRVNGTHIDDIQRSLHDLMFLLYDLKVIEYVDLYDGDPTIWLKDRRRR